MSKQNKQNLFAVFALLYTAFSWGIIWYPYRLLAESGISGALASFYTYGIASIVGGFIYWRHWHGLRNLPLRAYALCLAAGWTNLAFVLATIDGEVMRVMLLFYLSPIWTLMLARFWLKEKLTPMSYAVIVLSLIGAFIMLSDFANFSLPMPRSRAEWLGLSAGMGFSLSNVITRRSSDLSLPVKSLLVWLGVTVVSFVIMMVLGVSFSALEVMQANWPLLVLVGLMLVIATIAVQYGVTQMTATRASVIFLFELVVGAVASYYLANEALEWNEWVGGVLIIGAGLIAANQDDD